MLNVSHVSAGYSGVPALHDVSIHIKKGEILTIIGSNGAGKSTLARTITGLVKPSSGPPIQPIQQLPPHEMVALDWFM